ncbi:hypothetical protein CXF85_21555 [Colwellia sp. 75C3]|uniref:hypothetical protein n=1 Tax=Colwellia sp. 75C3 TaxID=888425 RepID=UPI000C33F307|nr:hypothetical protein [Colwellia sp. 75C3]PKG80707.1 hypothetical protein CXF85_21555 [Colwellia sp. 75C3]
MFNEVSYSDMNSKQKENYNFAQINARLVGFGFECSWLNNDYLGADFIAVGSQGVLQVQLKSRVTCEQKYSKELIITWIESDGTIYFVPHGILWDLMASRYDFTKGWSIANTPKWLRDALAEYRL